jgi:peptidoglycan hydrolase CwlO-like protein
MAYKFLFIGKANAEIERLTAENSKLTAERDEAKSALEANHGELAKQCEELQGQVTTQTLAATEASAKVTALEGELAGVKTELAAARDKLANPSAEIVKIASAKAAAITGAQGQPPLAVVPSGTPAGGAAASSGEDLIAQMNAIPNPSERTMFFRQHRAAILAASRKERGH